MEKLHSASYTEIIAIPYNEFVKIVDQMQAGNWF